MGALRSPGCGDVGVRGRLGHPLARLCHPWSPPHRGGSRGQGHAASPAPADMLRAPLPAHRLWSPSSQACFLRPPSRPFFCSKAASSTRTSSPPYDFALRSLSPPGGNGVGGCSHSTTCMGRACSIWDPLRLAEELACATLPRHTRTPWQTGAPTQLPVLSACRPWGGDSLGIPASCHCPTRVSLGKGTPLCHCSPGLSPNPAGFTRQGPLRLPGPGAALAACPPCRAPLGTMVRAGSRDVARS